MQDIRFSSSFDQMLYCLNRLHVFDSVIACSMVSGI